MTKGQNPLFLLARFHAEKTVSSQWNRYSRHSFTLIYIDLEKRIRKSWTRGTVDNTLANRNWVSHLPQEVLRTNPDGGKKGHAAVTANERIMKLCTANPATLARIDAILSGEDTTAPEHDVDLRTCTITAAARRYRISRPTLYRMIKSGRVKVMRLNGVNRVLIQSLVDCALNNNR